MYKYVRIKTRQLRKKYHILYKLKYWFINIGKLYFFAFLFMHIIVIKITIYLPFRLYAISIGIL